MKPAESLFRLWRQVSRSNRLVFLYMHVLHAAGRFAKADLLSINVFWLFKRKVFSMKVLKLNFNENTIVISSHTMNINV